MLDGPDIQERYMYLWTEWSGAQRLENFLSQKVKKNRSFFGKNVNSVITKSQNLSPSWNKTLDFTSSHSNLNKHFNIILQPTYVFKVSNCKFLQQNHIVMRGVGIVSP